MKAMNQHSLSLKVAVVVQILCYMTAISCLIPTIWQLKGHQYCVYAITVGRGDFPD